MPQVVRIPITNVFSGDYTGVIQVGPNRQPMNVLLDTGSSALAVDGKKYQPDTANGDQSTNLAQTESYGDGSSFTGAVISSTVTVGDGEAAVALPGCSVAVAYQATDQMFGQTDGILGLAYAPLDDAFELPGDTLANQFPADQVRGGIQATVTPYLTQLAQSGIVSDKIAFLTRRSFIQDGPDPASDPMNQGVMIIGGGEESTDLYQGEFQVVKVVSDDWYSTVLRSVIVGSGSPIAARLQGPQGMPSNSIIDSGTNSLNISPQMLSAMIAKFTPAQQRLLKQSIQDQQAVSMSDLDLSQWPVITFVMQGDAGDVRLDVSPSNYWQVNSPQVGFAQAAITEGDPGLVILGLPLMNGYFTIFDGEADGGRGVVKFAKAR